MALTVAPVLKQAKLAHCLVSPSADGEFFAQAMAHNGFPSIRASSAKKGDSAKARAVVAAFREAMAWVKGGGVLIVTPDGPRGPNEVMAPGALQIAKRTGAPVLLVGLAASPPHGWAAGTPPWSPPLRQGLRDLGRPLLRAGRRRRRGYRGPHRRLGGQTFGRHPKGRRTRGGRLIRRAPGET
uniref:DUF374 domain-containing protein n=1 Tax=Phenylobacterium glaciei TaxID=2803784 RepID=A0A974P2T8_9CAUL|nr:DUF374 domain-containing protein [Phenylobacterium glaciei]